MTEEALEEALSRPTPGVVERLAALDGDILVLGVGGKMGPSLARMAVRALRAAGSSRRVIGVSRFSSGEARARLEAWGIETIAADLLDPDQLARLPRCPLVMYMPARKFGSRGAEWETWATNTFLAGTAAHVFRDARIVAFSTGNVYGLAKVNSLGPSEDEPPAPIGEYAQSCLGRERMFEYGSRRFGTKVALIRLNYAVELRYGVTADLARAIAAGQPIDLTMGGCNVIWQGDANAHALCAFADCQSPPLVLNVTGPVVSVRQMAERLGERLGRRPELVGREAETALLSNAARSWALYGPPSVPLDDILDWTADWVAAGAPSSGKPTHFQVRDGSF